MSDMFFLLLILMVFWLLQRRQEGDHRLPLWCPGLLLGWASLVRLEGAVLIAAVTVGWFYARRWKDLVQLAGVAGFVWAPFFLRGFVTHAPWQLSRISTSLAWVAHLRNLAGNFDELTHLWIVQILLSVPFLSRNWYGMLINDLLIAATLIFMSIGYRRLAAGRWERDGVLTAMGAFCLIYLGVHCAWSAFEARYCLACLPFLLAFFVEGVHSLFWNGRRCLPGQALVISLLLVGYLSADIAAFKHTYHHPVPFESVFPRETFQWIRNNTPPEALFLSMDRILSLYEPAEPALHPGGRCRFLSLSAAEITCRRNLVTTLAVCYCTRVSAQR